MKPATRQQVAVLLPIDDEMPRLKTRCVVRVLACLIGVFATASMVYRHMLIHQAQERYAVHHRSVDNVVFSSAAGRSFSKPSVKNHTTDSNRLEHPSNDRSQSRPKFIVIDAMINSKHNESAMFPRSLPDAIKADRLMSLQDDGVADLADEDLILVRPLTRRREGEKKKSAAKKWKKTWDQTQKERKALVQEACIRHPGLHDDLFHVVNHEPSKLSNFLVSDRFKVIFSVVPMVASDFWQDTFRELLRKNGSAADSSAGQLDVGEVRNLSSYRAWEIRLRLRQYKKVIFVRDPFSRLLSAYRRKLLPPMTEENKLYGPIIAETYREGYTGKGSPGHLNITFKEFAYFVNDISNSNVSNNLWSPISEQTFPCQINYDVIGRLEDGPKEFEETLKSMKIQWLVKYKPSDFKGGSHEGSIYDHYFLKLWPSQIKNLYNVYQTDFDMFGYSIPTYMRPWVFEKF